ALRRRPRGGPGRGGVRPHRPVATAPLRARRRTAVGWVATRREDVGASSRSRPGAGIMERTTTRDPSMSAVVADAQTGKEALSSSTEVRTLVVDDQEAFRDALRHLIGAAPGFTLVGEACSGEDAIVAVEDLAPSLVLMDVRMPGIGGIQAARSIAERHPEL